MTPPSRWKKFLTNIFSSPHHVSYFFFGRHGSKKPDYFWPWQLLCDFISINGKKFGIIFFRIRIKFNAADPLKTNTEPKPSIASLYIIPVSTGRWLRGDPRGEVYHGVLRPQLLRHHGQQGGLHHPQRQGHAPQVYHL